jgi:hypothetical protein
MKTNIFAYFLPQFYPTPENDEFWGEGFTDWVTTRNAKSLFKGHCEPYKPLDLGYYDLSKRDEASKVINFSKEAGLDGLVYWHYWFGNGFKTLEKVPELHLSEKNINQNFFFAWSNADWTKSWQGDNDTLIFKQTYSEESAINHFNYLRQFFCDSRYLRQNNNFLFQVNHGLNNNVLKHMKILDDLCFKDFGNRIHFILPLDKLKIKLDSFIYSLSSFPPGEIYSGLFKYRIQRVFQEFKILKRPVIISQKSYLKSFSKFLRKNPSLIPCILSGWDNTPRYNERGVVIQGNIEDLIEGQINEIKKSKINHDFILVKAFNEWAEGNILEPYKLNSKNFYPYKKLKSLKHE